MNTILVLGGLLLAIAGIVVMLQAVSAMRHTLVAEGSAKKFAGIVLLPNVSVPIIRDFRAAHPQHPLLKRLPIASGLIVAGIVLFMVSNMRNSGAN